MSELDYKTFDLLEVLTGRGYPEDTFEIFFNEADAYRLSKIGRELETLPRHNPLKPDEDNPQRAELDREWLDLAKKMKSEAYKVTVRGVPAHLRDNMAKEIREKFDIKPFAELTGDAAHEFIERKWALFIVKLESPEGAIIAPLTREHAKNLRELAPDKVQSQIDAAIDKLMGGVSEGYESAAMDVDFLSDASPEA